MRVAVSGATGFVGVGAGRCPGGRGARGEPHSPAGPSSTAGRVIPCFVRHRRARGAMRAALNGHEAAYFLVHSLAGRLRRPRIACRRTFAAAATEAGVAQVVYLGGLGDESDDLSDHLRSRREVESDPAGRGADHRIASRDRRRRRRHQLGDAATAGRAFAGDDHASLGGDASQPIALDDVVATSPPCWAGRRPSAGPTRSAGPR